MMLCKSSVRMMANLSSNISGLIILLTFVPSSYTFNSDHNEKEETPKLLAKEIGPFVKTEHAVSGNVFIQDNATLIIRDFNYDGTVRQKFIVLNGYLLTAIFILKHNKHSFDNHMIFIIGPFRIFLWRPRRRPRYWRVYFVSISDL